MLTRLVTRALEVEPWTNVVGVARTLLALATATTLLASRTDSLFRPVLGNPDTPTCDVGAASLGLFCLPGPLPLLHWAAIGILLVVASGWRPRLTGVLHYWVSASYVLNATMVDGGDQVAAILTLLLIPVTLTDSRKWHWDPVPQRATGAWPLLARLTAVTCLVLIQIQVAGIYFHATVGKVAVEQWANGTALYYFLQDPTFGAPDWCRWMLVPFLHNGLTLTAMTWGVLVAEFVLSAGLLVHARYRQPILWLGIALHIGILLFQGISSFSVIMIAALVLYLRVYDPPFRRPAVPSLSFGATTHQATARPRLVGQGAMKMRLMFTSAALIATIVCVGCGDQPLQPASVDGHQPVQRGSEFSGEELFRAIMFGQGEAAELLPITAGGCDEAAGVGAAGLSTDALRAAVEARLIEAGDNDEAAVMALLEELSPQLDELKLMEPDASGEAVDTLVAAVGDADRGYFDAFAEQVTSGDHEAIREAVLDGRERLAEQAHQQFVDIGAGVGYVIAYNTAVVVNKVLLIGWKFDESLVYEELVVNEIALAF